MSDSDDDLLVVPDFLKKKTVYEVLTPRRRSRKPTTPLSPVLYPVRFGAKAGKGKQRVSKFSLDSLFADNKHCEDVNKQDEEIVNMKKKFEQGGNYMNIVNEAEDKESINLSQNDSLDSLCGDSSQVTSIGMTQLNGIRSLLRNDFPDTFPGMELIVREEGEEVTTEYYRKLVAYHLDDENVGEADEELVQVCRDLLRTGSLDSTTPQHVWVAVWKLMCFCQHADIRQLAYQFLMQSLSILPAFLSRATNFVKTLENFGVDLFKLQTDDESTSEVNRIIRTLSVCLSFEEASEVTFTVTKNIRKSFYSERLLFFVKLYTSLLHQSQLSPHELTCVAMVSLVLCCDKIIVSERHHFQVLAAQALDRFEDWNVVQMVSISKSITNIVSHHHNVLQICDFILPSKRGLELKQVFALLAASTIQREGHEFFKYIILPLGPGEVMKLLSDYHLDEESDYYIANSFLLLLEQSLPTDHITAHQKRGLKNVVDKLRSLNAEVKEGGGRFLDRTKPAEFHWNSHTQANVVGSFYYGYWVLQVPGAWIALKMGATRIFGYGVLLASLMSILTPVATRYHVMGLVCVRVVQGVFLGVTFPCVIAIWARWAPPLERSTMVTMAIAGSPVGNIIAIPLTGILAKYGFDGGWPSVFYFFGFLGLLWYGLWEYIVYDSPDSHPSITDKEKRYINKTIGEKPFDPLKETLPLCAIFTSVPMWGIIIGHFGACWGYYTLFTQMPTYLKDIQHLDIKTMGMVAATPYILKAFLGPVGGISADMILKYNYLSVRGVRVLFYALGCISAGFFIMMTGYFVRKGEAIAFLILGVGFSGLNATGYAVNHLDLAPRYAGVLMGVTNTFATMPGFLSPLLTGYIASNKKASEWRTVFWITFIVYIVCTGLYSIMCSGEKQWWAEGAKVKPTPESETGMVDKSTETEDSVSVAIDDIESQSAEDSMQNKKDKTD